MSVLVRSTQRDDVCATAAAATSVTASTIRMGIRFIDILPGSFRSELKLAAPAGGRRRDHELARALGESLRRAVARIELRGGVEVARRDGEVARSVGGQRPGEDGTCFRP